MLQTGDRLVAAYLLDVISIITIYIAYGFTVRFQKFDEERSAIFYRLFLVLSDFRPFKISLIVSESNDKNLSQEAAITRPLQVRSGSKYQTSSFIFFLSLVPKHYCPLSRQRAILRTPF